MIGLYGLQQNISYLMFYTGDMARHGNIGANYFNGVTVGGDAYDSVGAVTPGSPLDTAGVATGDLIRFDWPLNYQRDLWQNTRALSASVRWMLYALQALQPIFYLRFARLFYEDHDEAHAAWMTTFNRIG